MNKTAFGGLDEALAAIDGLGALASREVQVKALTAAAQPIAADIEARLQSHRVTGKLEADISVGESHEAAAQGDVAVLIGAKRQAYKLRWLEFGTVKQRATPVIRPAWDAARGTFASRAVDEFHKAYRSVIAKYSRGKAA